MNINWRDILGEISGYKQLFDLALEDVQAKKATIADLTARLTTADARIAELDTLLTEAQAMILKLTPATPAPPAPDNTTETDTAPAQPQEGTVPRTIRSQQVIDCPMEKRVVPLDALAAGANHDQFTCRHCTYYKRETCDHVTCKYRG